MTVSIADRQVIQDVSKGAIARAILNLISNSCDRPITFTTAQFPQDLVFLAKVYASTRADEMAMVLDWSDAQKSAFLEMQFNAQHSYYQDHYADAEFLIIWDGDRPIGRLYIERWEDEIRSDEFRIIDIALLPEARNQGIGSTILKAIQDLAQTEKRAVRIHVEQNNPALRLYNRLGFQKIGEVGVYFLMEWQSTS